MLTISGSQITNHQFVPGQGIKLPRKQGWGKHGAHMDPVGPRWAHIGPTNLGIKVAFKKWKLRKITPWKVNEPTNYMMKTYDVNMMWISQYQSHFSSWCLTSFVVAILIKFYCFTSSFLPKLEAKSAVPELTTRDSKNIADGSYLSKLWSDVAIYVCVLGHSRLSVYFTKLDIYFLNSIAC